MPSQKKNNRGEIQETVNVYAKYSNIGMQMLFTILLGVFGGLKLDEYLGMSFKIFTMLGSVISVFASIYIVIKGIIKK